MSDYEKSIRSAFISVGLAITISIIIAIFKILK